MSAPLVDLSSRPERARVKHSETTAAEATGFQSVRDNEFKRSKERRRQQAMQEGLQRPSSPKTSDRPRDPIFAYFEEETKKKNDASFVFLLWGSENSESSNTWAVDVPVTDIEDEEEIFKLLKKKYNKELGLSRIVHVFQRFKRLKPVTFRFICRDSKRFLAFVQPLNLDKLQKEYSEKLKEATEAWLSIASFDSGDLQDFCYCDSSGEYIHCNIFCPTDFPEESSSSTCPFQDWDWYNDRIRWIETASFLSCYFRNPAGARCQNILNGSSGPHFIHQYRHIYFPVNEFRFQNRYVEFNGLCVETAWCPIKSAIAFLSILLSSLLIGGTFFWGSWEVIFGAGSFIIALLMLVLTVLSRYDV